MIDTTYGDVRHAYFALMALAREKMQLQFSVVLKWKRILGVLKPLVEQAEELQGDLLQEHTERDADGKPLTGDMPNTVKVKDVAAYNKAVNEMLDTPVQVGADLVTPADFGDGTAMVSSSLAELLAELGPFFQENR